MAQWPRALCPYPGIHAQDASGDDAVMRPGIFNEVLYEIWCFFFRLYLGEMAKAEDLYGHHFKWEHTIENLH